MVEDNYQLLPDSPIETVEEYRAAGGGRGLERALRMQPAEVISEVRRSGLRGRGGAGFPTGLKWESVAEAARESTAFVVCNAAEGEPGTYKDRPLISANPYGVLEGILIACHAVGAPRGFVGIKERFRPEWERLVAARDELVAAGWKGAEEIRVVLGPDDYLFGEEKALLEVIEGKPAMPRILPPYQLGLFATMQEANPTVVNNVETLAHAAKILAEGPDRFRSVGTEESPGTMLFTVTGDVDRPGTYELPLGTALRTLICDIAGAEDILAIIPGTSNAIITPHLLDLPMDFDSFNEAGVGLGSGGFMVYDSSRDIVQVTAALARFLAIESCGQCLACKLGTADLADRLERLVRGEGTEEDLTSIRKRTESVTDQNRCYLPVGAALLIRSALDEFADRFRERLDAPSPPEAAVAVPKISAIEPDTGAVSYDPVE